MNASRPKPRRQSQLPSFRVAVLLAAHTGEPTELVQLTSGSMFTVGPDRIPPEQYPDIRSFIHELHGQLPAGFAEHSRLFNHSRAE